MAHELTHALQDQHSDLEKWDDQTPDDVSHDAAGDQDHLAKDEMDTARDAVAEGQATAVMMDYILKPTGQEPHQGSRGARCRQVADELHRRLARDGARAAAALGIDALSLSRGPQLRAGHLDGSGPDRGLCRRARPPADLELGDHQPARLRDRSTSRPFLCCPTFIPSSTRSTCPTTSARSASSTCTSSPSSSAATTRPAT